MNIKHIVYTFFFMALMGVISKTSEALKMVNTSNQTIHISCFLREYCSNRKICKGIAYTFHLLPGNTKDINVNIKAQLIEIELSFLYDTLSKEYSNKFVVKHNEIININDLLHDGDVIIDMSGT